MIYLKKFWENPLMRKIIIGTGIFIFILIFLLLSASCSSKSKTYTYEEIETENNGLDDILPTNTEE